MKKIRVVIVEDELIAAELLREVLEDHDVEVLDIVDTGKAAIDVCLAERPDVVFMDIMLRDKVSGSEAALAISKQASEIKIIFLTAYTDTEMVDYAVASRAVGYLSKPYNEAQIIANLRLATVPQHGEVHEHPLAEEPVMLVDGYVYHPQQKRLLQEGEEVHLGTKGLKLVQLLCTQPNISISNEQISQEIWGKAVDDRTLRSLVFRVRAATNEALIKNMSGTGYLIQTA